jgi:hypothetical protein
MIDLQYDLHIPARDLQAIGEWLEQNMPNPVLPEQQRWTMGYSTDGRSGIRFLNDHDATFFSLKWGYKFD